MNEDHTVEGTMAHAQRAAILAALQLTKYNLSEASRQLRIGRTTLYRLIHDYQIVLDAAVRRQSGTVRLSTSARSQSQVRLVDGIWYLENPAFSLPGL